MIDESALIMLINERFDDMNGRIDELKHDIVARQDRHDVEDRERFQELRQEIEPLKHMKRSVAGSAGVAVVAIQSIAEFLRAYFK